MYTVDGIKMTSPPIPMQYDPAVRHPVFFTEKLKRQLVLPTLENTKTAVGISGGGRTGEMGRLGAPVACENSGWSIAATGYVISQKTTGVLGKL